MSEKELIETLETLQRQIRSLADVELTGLIYSLKIRSDEADEADEAGTEQSADA